MRIERTPIPEDLRQRVLSAIAVELERDRAEQRRNTPDNGGASVWATTGDSAADQVAGQVPGAGQVRGAAPANGAALPDGPVLADGAALADHAAPGSGAGDVDSAALANGVTLAYGTAADWVAPAGETAAAGETAPVDWAAPADEAALAPGASLADGTTFAYGVPLADGDVAPGGEVAPDGPATTHGAGPAPGASLADGVTYAYGLPLADGGPAADGASPPGGPAMTDEAPPAGHTARPEGAVGAVAPEPGSVPDDDRAGQAAEPKAEASWSALPLPRRAPGENGAPPPPAHLRREYLPPAWLGRRLDADAHTEPIPKVSGIRPDDPVSRQGDRPEAAGPVTFPAPPSRPAPSEPIPPPTGPRDDAAPGPAANPAEPPWAAAPPAAGTPAAPPGALPSGALPSGAGSAMPVLAASAAPEAAPTAPDVNTAPARQAGSAPSAQPAPPGPAAPPSAGMPAPVAPARALYSWPSGPGGTPPGNGTATARPAVRPAAQAPKRPQRAGRRWRIAGIILAVLALVVAGAIALLASGHGGRAGRTTGSGPGSRGAGAAARNRAAAWVAVQVSRTAVVACDPVMCQALRAQGVPELSLYQLGPQTTSPLHSQIIVATAAVRAQFGGLLGSVYAPAVLASFGAGPDRIDVRQTAQHAAGAYRAMVRADLAFRRASGAELLHSGRIAATFAARQQLAAGLVDPRLLITIAQMAAIHPIYIVDFGRPAPGAGPGVPLRQADLAEDAHARLYPGRAASPGYVRTMVTFLRAQHGGFRPAYVRTVHLPGGAAVLRIDFTAPSPLGLLGPHA